MDDEKPSPHDVTIMLRRELLELGWYDRAIGRMLSSGAWVRVRHGAYCPAPEWVGLEDWGQHVVRTRAVLKQARTEVVVSHVSAHLLHGGPSWGLALDAVDTTRRDGRIGRNEAGVRQHRGRILPGDVVTRHGVAVMSATRTALEVTTCTSVEVGLVAVNHLLHTGLVTEEGLEGRYRHGDEPIDRWSHTLNTDVVLRLARKKIESVGESRTFYLLWRWHLPLPELQYEVRDASGRVVARVDFAWPELGVFLEFDGLVKYRRPFEKGMDPEEVVIAEKRREDLVVRLTGWRCIRLVWRDLQTPRRTAAMIGDFLAGRTTAA